MIGLRRNLLNRPENDRTMRVMHMIRKGQMQGVDKGDILSQVAFIARLFGVAA